MREDYFGEMALVENRRRSATVTALTDTLLLVLSRQNFEKLYKQKPALKLNLEVAIRSRQLARQLLFKWLRPDEVVYFLAPQASCDSLSKSGSADPCLCGAIRSVLWLVCNRTLLHCWVGSLAIIDRSDRLDHMAGDRLGQRLLHCDQSTRGMA